MHLRNLTNFLKEENLKNSTKIMSLEVINYLSIKFYGFIINDLILIYNNIYINAINKYIIFIIRKKTKNSIDY